MNHPVIFTEARLGMHLNVLKFSDWCVIVFLRIQGGQIAYTSLTYLGGLLPRMPHIICRVFWKRPQRWGTLCVFITLDLAFASHVTHRNESCHTYGWVMSHIWMSHVTHMNESCHTYEWVRSHIWMSHVTHMNESGHTYERVMSCMWMSHVTHM